MARISKSQLEKLQKKYKTDGAIGELFGITRQAVHQLRAKYGIAAIKEKHTARNQEIVGLFKNGTAGTKLANRYKLSVSQTYRIINETAVAKKRKKK